jgi:hypothetical protein
MIAPAQEIVQDHVKEQDARPHHAMWLLASFIPFL